MSNNQSIQENRATSSGRVIDTTVEASRTFMNTQTTGQPQKMDINFEAIPAELIEKGNWVLWRWELRNGKLTKPPYQVSGESAKSNDPSTWNNFQPIHQAYKAGEWDGIGFMLCGDGYVGIDWDDCRDKRTGDIDPEILKHIWEFDSYTEVSPSGTGLKTLIKGKLPGSGHHSKNIGLFADTRYFCITGQVLDSVSKQIESRQPQLERLIRRYWPDDFKPKEDNSKQSKQPTDISDSELIEKALSANDGGKFDQLWDGYHTDYPSQSEADLALCTKLAFWTGKDAERIDALFRQSGLMREKWGREDYRKRTINRAIANTANTYQGQIGQPDFRKQAGRHSAEQGRAESAAGPPPIDIFGDTTLAGQPEWPSGACPEVINDFAIDSAERLGVDPAMIAIPAIIVSAAAVTDDFVVQPKRFDTGWRESARLWGAVVAEPGEKKTPALDTATAPLKDIERQLYQEDKARWKQYEAELEQYEQGRKGRKSADTSKPEKPPQRRKMVGDATIESLCDVLSENPDGILCHRDELSGWVGSFDAYRSSGSARKDRPDWLELYNGGPRLIDRVKRGRIYVPNWSACLLGGIQPGPMRRHMGKIVDDGLLQRIMIFYGRRIGAGEDRAPNVSAVSAYRQTIYRLTELRLVNENRAIKFLEEAQVQRQIVSTVAENVSSLPDTSPALKACLSKWEGLFARIALTFHLIETAARQVEERPAKHIDEATAEQAARLMLDFLLPNTVRFYLDVLGGTDHLQHARWIAGYILSRDLEKITAREIYRAYNKLRSDPQGIDSAMHTLTVSGWVKPLDTGKRASPNRWEVDKRVHSLFASRAEAERQRREAERAKVYAATKLLGLTPAADTGGGN